MMKFIRRNMGVILKKTQDIVAILGSIAAAGWSYFKLSNSCEKEIFVKQSILCV